MLDASKFDRTDPVTGKTDAQGVCFVAEASELGLPAGCQPRLMLTLDNCPAPGLSRSFRRDHTDMSGGDVAGWRYVDADGGSFTMLIIND